MPNLTNFVRARLTQAINADSTSIAVKYTTSNYYKAPPVPTGVTTLKLVDNPDNPQNVEIITYAGLTGTTPNFTLTGVVRGVSGTTAKKWRGGCFVESVADSQTIEDISNAVTELQSYHYEPMVQLGFNDSVYYDPTQNKVPNFYTTPDGDIYVMKVSN